MTDLKTFDNVNKAFLCDKKFHVRYHSFSVLLSYILFKHTRIFKGIIEIVHIEARDVPSKSHTFPDKRS